MAPRSAMFARKVAAAARAARAAASRSSRGGPRGGVVSPQRFTGQGTWDGFSNLSRPFFPWQDILPPTFEVPHSGSTFSDQQLEEEEFELKEEDLESDEAMWALYERWCRHFKVQRDHAEMSRRFDRFKTYMLQVHAVNSSDLDMKMEIDESADAFVHDEMTDPQINMRMVDWYETRKEKRRCGPSKGGFVVKEKDLDSHEAFWALYKRWCKHFKVRRDHHEMTRRFETFRGSVTQVHAVNTSDEIPMLLEVNKLADEMFVPDDEAMEHVDPYIQRRVIHWHRVRNESRRRRLMLEEWERLTENPLPNTAGPEASTDG